MQAGERAASASPSFGFEAATGAMNLQQKIAMLRDQLSLPTDRSLAETVDTAVHELSVDIELEAPTLMQKVDACLQTMGTAPAKATEPTDALESGGLALGYGGSVEGYGRYGGFSGFGGFSGTGGYGGYGAYGGGYGGGYGSYSNSRGGSFGDFGGFGSSRRFNGYTGNGGSVSSGGYGRYGDLGGFGSFGGGYGSRLGGSYGGRGYGGRGYGGAYGTYGDHGQGFGSGGGGPYERLRRRGVAVTGVQPSVVGVQRGVHAPEPAAVSLQEKVRMLRDQLGLREDRSLVETVDEAAGQLGVEKAEARTLMQTVDACLQTMGTAATELPTFGVAATSPGALPPVARTPSATRAAQATRAQRLTSATGSYIGNRFGFNAGDNGGDLGHAGRGSAFDRARARANS